MNQMKPMASLGPSLLARKGAARPAMRPQFQSMQQFRDMTARQMSDDLGWNDMGHDQDMPQAEPVAELAPPAPVPAAPAPVAQVVALVPEAPAPVEMPAELPAVLQQREEIAAQLSAPLPAESAKPRKRVSALSSGRKAAFTLRLDAERHLKLRLASTLANRSAQNLLTDALDKLLESLPEVAELAVQVRKSH